MKRLDLLAVLMVLSSSAHAGESFSFTVGGHHIHIEVPRSCRSTSCVSVSIPGIYATHRRNERRDEPDVAPKATPAPPILASAPTAVPPVAKPVAESVACAPPPAIEKPTAAAVEAAAARPSTFQPPRMSAMTPRVDPSAQAAPPPPPVKATPIASPAQAAPVVPPVKAAPVVPPAPPVPAAAPPLQKISHDVDAQPPATPLGDWRTEAKAGSVRIETCGHSLCGYVLDPATGAAGETVMFDMRPRASSGAAASEWSGSIFSRSSGNTYYATIAMKGADSLRIEACAVGRLFCSANTWSRIAGKPEKLITSRQIPPEPRS
jgi:uncharacterized protein (DUF2147 family)